MKVAQLVSLTAVVLCCIAYQASAADPADLAGDQSELALKFDRLDTLAKRIAELAEKDSPERADQLRTAIRKSQELALPERFAKVVALLEDEQLAAAAAGQTEIAEQLRILLDLLLADPNEARLEAERKRLREILRRIRGHIRTQRELRAATLTEAKPKDLANKQDALKGDVGKLEQEINEGNDKSSNSVGENNDAESSKADGENQQTERGNTQDGQQPEQSQQAGQPQPGEQSAGQQSQQQRAAQRLAEAQQAMQQAIQQLQQAEQDSEEQRQAQQEQAEQKQADAQRALEDAREEIERALRQLREEEQQRRLTKLAVRLKRMLADQIDINKLTLQTAEDRSNRGERATKIAATGLATREREVGRIADGALKLLREDAKSVAFPEVLSQIRDDITTVSGRLADAELGNTTQALQTEIVASLEEAIESLDKTLKEMEDRKQAGQQGQASGQPGEPPVVDKLAELRMIRTLQARILRRTKFWHKALSAGVAEPAAAHAALERIAVRQGRLSQAARNLQSSR